MLSFYQTQQPSIFIPFYKLQRNSELWQWDKNNKQLLRKSKKIFLMALNFACTFWREQTLDMWLGLRKPGICINYICFKNGTVFIRIEARTFISYERLLTWHLYEPFPHFIWASVYFRVLNPCIYSGPGVYMSPAIIPINMVLFLVTVYDKHTL